MRVSFTPSSSTKSYTQYRQLQLRICHASRAYLGKYLTIPATILRDQFQLGRNFVFGITKLKKAMWRYTAFTRGSLNNQQFDDLITYLSSLGNYIAAISCLTGSRSRCAKQADVPIQNHITLKLRNGREGRYSLIPQKICEVLYTDRYGRLYMYLKPTFLQCWFTIA